MIFFRIFIFIGSSCIGLISAQATVVAGRLDDLTHIQQRNNYGQQQMTLSAIHFAQQAALKYQYGGECATSCPLGCCASADTLKSEGGVFMLLNSQATALAEAHHISALSACESYNRVAVTPKSCSTEIESFNTTMPEAGWFDEKGKCKSSVPETCAIITSIPGGSVFGNAKVNCQKSGKCTDDFYSSCVKNADGSVSIKMSDRTVKLSIDNFKDKDSLIKAGVAYDKADAMLSQFKEVRPMIVKFKGELIHASTSYIFQAITRRYHQTQDLDVNK